MNDTFAAGAFLQKRILISGASSGIGRATAQLLARFGARLLLIGRSPDRLAETLSSLDGSGHITSAIDFADPDAAVDSISALVATFGSLDGIFHSAGAGAVRPIKMTKAKHLTDVMSASVGGAFALSRAAAHRDVMADGGSVVLMSSVAGMRGQIAMSAYSASKGAIDAAVKSLACEFAPRKIRVNSIVAGAIRTEMHDRVVAAMPSESVEDYEAKHLLGFGRPVDVANIAAFLISDASRWVTGANWVVDGGYLAK